MIMDYEFLESLPQWVEQEFYRTAYDYETGKSYRIKPNYCIIQTPNGPKVEFDNKGYVYVRPSDEYEDFALKCKIEGFTDLCIRRRTIRSWCDVDLPNNVVFFRNCNLPPLKDTPLNYKRLWISFDSDYSDNITSMFANMGRFGFSLSTGNGPTLIISKRIGSKIKIEFGDDEPLLVNDAFDLQDWLVTNGYERLT
ncbi:hypothetical protein RsoM2USA_320 [Ralstonia phage RsoM2USA]|nr:hypothetical protein RsoM2USA_320 [Ralstonia phage RsoM2USA]